MLKKELRYFLTAVMFFSRIPVPRWVGYSEEQLNKSTRYFPAIGWIIGTIGALLLWGGLHIFPPILAVLLSMVLTIFVTGAFHEDGFADFCDGYGGGYTKERILTIMKDSRLGTYGTIGLVAMLATKLMCLNFLVEYNFIALYIAAHVVSRATAVALIATSKYVRMDDSSKSKPVGNETKPAELWFSMLFTLPAFYWVGWKISFAFLLANLVLFLTFKWYIHKKTGGYTGDVLGALQQLSEVLFFITSVLVYYS